MAKQWIQDNALKIVVAAATIIAAYAILTDNVREMKPDVQKNTEHRIKFEERVANIEKGVERILTAVEK